jgi:hypothetical protein
LEGRAAAAELNFEVIKPPAVVSPTEPLWRGWKTRSGSPLWNRNIMDTVPLLGEILDVAKKLLLD